jgi:D-beta-D-heptose 7-phosphate kinase/D-beta-D-heptose 1-phosphate adenosyltransferase
MERLLDMFDKIDGKTPAESPRVVLAGDFMLDEYVHGDVERISQEAPIPVLHVTKRDYRSGGAGNVATAIAALGGSVQCVGVVGDDPRAKKVIEPLAAAGVGTSGLIALSDRPTTIKTRYVGLAQHKNPHQILRVDDEVTAPLPEDVAKKLIAAVTAALDADSILAFQDHNKGVLSDATAGAMIAAAKKAGAKIVVDPAPIADVGRYRGATLLTPNRHEAALASGVTITDESSCQAAAKAMLERTDAKAVVITLDAQGGYLFDGKNGRIIPTSPRAVADGTGAGDAVMAMLCVALAGGCDIAAAVELANVAGGLEVERFGVVPVTRDEIHDELRRRIGLRRSKTMDRKRLAQEIERIRRDGGSVVFTNGCFDLLHMGHVNYLQQAREHGTCLVVAINSDASVRRLKGPQRPVIGQDERAKMLASLECIDFVTIFDEDTPEALLGLLRPDVLVKGGSTDVIVGKDFVESYGGKVQRLDLIAGMSTTDIINRIVETH